ncbi:YihY/virulence factor BrkB family protein [Rhodothermus profundi]|uniref:Membrane protein n=1 Tax=Rhodothermus profundi TaxID=633813 RepID=A0A1M6S0W1_9BACT|nr:YihY/virulence factor BrkB family protein [Rhodothermus profundi]SHK38361.1 membrane protein [Rhodothermus profundi]
MRLRWAVLREVFWRVRQTLRYYVVGLYHLLNRKPVFLWAQAIAFKVLVTIVPVLVLATGLLGRILQQERPFQAVARFLQDFLPPYQSDQLLQFLEQLQRASGTFTLIGILGLLYATMTLFTTLRGVLSQVFDEPWHQGRSVLRGYLFDLRMMVQVGVLFLLTFSVSLAINAVDLSWLHRFRLDYRWVQEGWRQLLQVLGLLIPYLLSLAMFFQLYYFTPKPRPPLRGALLGAVVAALLWEAAKTAFAFYAARSAFFERFANSGLSAIGRVFGLILAFGFWVYYSSVVFILGALLVLLYEKRRRDQPEASVSIAVSKVDA